MFYTYVLESEIDKTLYVGLTNDVTARLKRHNKGMEAYTKTKLPWELVFYVAFCTRSEAASFEKYLKSGSGKEFIRNHVVRSSNLSSGAEQA